MATNLVRTSKTLVKALNSKGLMITFASKQYIGRDRKPHNYYSINEAVWCEERNRFNHNELYSSASMVRIVMFLRDMWFELNGWELPTDQPLWNTIREDLKAKKNG